LKREGYRLLGRNLTTPAGEVDLVLEAPDGATVVFVEVKTRAEGRGGPPEHRVDPRKQRRVARAAHQVLRRHRLTDRPVRYDVVGVEPAARGAPRVRHHPGAFSAPAGW
jgi:putative endonuclease